MNHYSQNNNLYKNEMNFGVFFRNYNRNITLRRRECMEYT